jgi:hypothetical protein
LTSGSAGEPEYLADYVLACARLKVILLASTNVVRRQQHYGESCGPGVVLKFLDDRLSTTR